MSFVNLEPGVAGIIKSFLEKSGINDPIRIELQSTGCCDPSLGLCVDEARDEDLVHEAEGVKILISPETRNAVGLVTISYLDDVQNNGYVITSSKPLSEWEGFGVCHIKPKAGQK